MAKARQKNSDNVIVVKNLHKSYKKLKVLNGISFNVKHGSVLALLGPNGAGKTTIVRIMSTLLNFESGAVSIKGYDVATEADKVRGIIGLTGQSAAVDELLTGRENLVMVGQLYRLTKASAKARADELLAEFDLVDAANRAAKTYSGGMRRRLDLAVSLIAAPPIIFLDEPTTGLDPRSRNAMWNLIRTLVAGGTTILLTTQYLEEADQLADHIVVIDEGKVIAEGTALELKSKVGKDRLELLFASLSAYNKAIALLGEAVVGQNEKERSLSLVITDTSSDVRNVLEKLSDKKIPLESLAVHKPTLDDVFMSLTGKQKQSVEEEEV